MEIQTSGRPIETLVEKVLSMNILSSDYFKELFKLKTYHEVVDEIYNQVDHVEPWMTGNCRGPSTAFCLLYKLFTMKVTVNQMHGLLKHPDSPYIRAIGFLYLRYIAEPKTLWNWCEPYVKDDEEFSPGSDRRMTTMGVYVRDLLLGQYYFDTLLPRTPVLIMRQIVANLERMKLPTKHAGVTGESTRRGSEETARRPPSVKAALSVSFGQRAPHRASTRDSSPVRRTLPPPRERGHDDDVRKSSPSTHRGHSREGPSRDQDRDRDRRDRDRDRDRDWRRERRHEHDRHGGDRDSGDRDSHGSKYLGRDNGRREYERNGRDGDRRRESSSCRRRSRSRSPSRSMQIQGSDRRASPFENGGGNKETVVSSNLAKLKDLYGDVSDKNDDTYTEKRRKDSSTDEVIRLGGSSWK